MGEKVENIGQIVFADMDIEDMATVGKAITGENYGSVSSEIKDANELAINKLGADVDGSDIAGVKAGILAGYASGESHKVFGMIEEAYKNVPGSAITATGGIPRTYDFEMSGESFSSLSPSEVAELHVNANMKLSKQNEFAETLFPTLVQPVGTVIFKPTITVTMAVKPFLRDGSKTGNRLTPITYDLNDLDGIFSANGNRVYPVVGIKDEFDAFLDVDVKRPVKDPVSGADIETAPILINTRVPLIDISQSAAELAGGVADDKTTLAPGTKVSAIHIKVGNERYALDAAGLRDAIFYGTPNGSKKNDLQLVSDNQMAIKLKELVKEDGTAGTEFADADDVTFIYDTRLSGTGSTVEKDLVVDVSEFKLIKMIRAGVEVVAADPDYGDLKAVGDKVTKDTVKSVSLEAYISNEDMRRTGIEISSDIKTEEHVLKPFTAITVVTPAKGLAGKYSDKQLIDTLASHIVPLVNVDAVMTLLSAGKTARAMTGEGTIGTKFKTGIASEVIKPTYVTEDLDLTNVVNNWQSKDKDEDIAGAIISVVKNVLAKLNSSSNLADYREVALGRPNDFVLAVGSNVAAFLPKTLKVEDYTIKVVSSRVKQMQGKIFLVPGNFQSDRNSKLDISAFGVYAYTPVLLGESPVDGKIKYTAHPIGKHIVTNYVIGEINVTGLGLDGVLGKAVYNTKAI